MKTLQANRRRKTIEELLLSRSDHGGPKWNGTTYNRLVYSRAIVESTHQCVFSGCCAISDIYRRQLFGLPETTLLCQQYQS
jgi:hypothetical protein